VDATFPASHAKRDVIRHYCGRDALLDALPRDPGWHAKRKVIRLIGGRDALPRDPGWHVQ